MAIVPDASKIKSVTVTAGSPVYIPNNATIIGTSVTGTATFDSLCADTDVPPYECFGFAIPTNDEVSSGQAWGEPDHAKVKEIVIDNVIYSFAEQSNSLGNGTFPQTTFIDALKTVPIFASITNGWAGCDGETADLAKYTFIMFRTIPSIAETMYLNVVYHVPAFVSTALVRIPALTIAQINAEVGVTIDCPCIDPS